MRGIVPCAAAPTTSPSATNANHVLERWLEVAQSLALFAERGAYPKEWMEPGIRDYRQTSFKLLSSEIHDTVLAKLA